MNDKEGGTNVAHARGLYALVPGEVQALGDRDQLVPCRFEFLDGVWHDFMTASSIAQSVNNIRGERPKRTLTQSSRELRG